MTLGATTLPYMPATLMPGWTLGATTLPYMPATLMPGWSIRRNLQQGSWWLKGVLATNHTLAPESSGDCGFTYFYLQQPIHRILPTGSVECVNPGCHHTPIYASNTHARLEHQEKPATGILVVEGRFGDKSHTCP